ncbi:MAG: hypothetical protein ACETWG_02460 [Candidatus Neomarinimicrobiota bacterium]
MVKKHKVKKLKPVPVRQLAPPPRRVPVKAAPATPAAAPRMSVKGERAATTDTYTKSLSPEARAELEIRAKMMAEVRKFAEENPEAVSQLLRVWLAAGKEK